MVVIAARSRRSFSASHMSRGLRLTTPVSNAGATTVPTVRTVSRKPARTAGPLGSVMAATPGSPEHPISGPALDHAGEQRGRDHRADRAHGVQETRANGRPARLGHGRNTGLAGTPDLGACA